MKPPFDMGKVVPALKFLQETSKEHLSRIEHLAASIGGLFQSAAPSNPLQLLSPQAMQNPISQSQTAQSTGEFHQSRIQASKNKISPFQKPPITRRG